MFKFLILYQGDQAKEYATHVQDCLHGSAEVLSVDTRLVKDDKSCLDTQIYQAVLLAIRECTHAIAIAAFDERLASVAGNLWLEVGLWLAMKSRSTMLVCVQDQSTVAVPSDLAGLSAPRFQNVSDLQNRVQKFLIEIVAGSGNASADSRIADEIKIRHTMLNRSPGKQAKVSELVKCARSTDASCIYREELLSFVSELLRMGKNTRESAVIECCFRRIAGLCTTLADFASAPAKRTTSIVRSQSINELVSVMRDLQTTGRDLLVRYDTNTIPEPDEWKRIEYYVRYRLLDVAGNHKEAQGKILPEMEPLDTGITEFIEWASEWAKPRSSRVAEFCKPSKSSLSAIREDLIAKGRFAGCVAEVLECLGRDYFGQCRDVIRNGLADITDEATMPDRIRGILNALPHNTGLDQLPSVWPRR